MKLSHAILLPCTIVAAATIKPRQHDHTGSSYSSPNSPYFSTALSWPEKYMLAIIESARESFVSWTKSSSQRAKLASVTPVAPRLRNDTLRKVFKYGPYTIGPQGTMNNPFNLVSWMAMDRNSQNWLLNIKTKDDLCSGCTVIAGQASITLPDGRRVETTDGLFVHHILSSDVTKHVPNFISSCGTKNIKEVPLNFEPVNGGGTDFLEVGTDHQEDQVLWTSTDGKFPSGFHVGKDDEIHVNVEILNYNKEKRDFYVTYEIEYYPELVGHNAQEQLIDMLACDHVTKVALGHDGPANTTSAKFMVYKDGNIIDAKGHLHNGGSKMFMFINDKPVCASEAVYGGQDPASIAKKGASITSMTPCTVPIPIKKGDWLSMGAEYDLKNHPQRKSTDGTVGGTEDAMGMWSLVFVPDGSP